MTKQPFGETRMDRLADEAGSDGAKQVLTQQILAAVTALAESVERLRGEQAVMHSLLVELMQQQRANQEPEQPPETTPKFTATFSQYSPGELFEDTAGFDMKLTFADAESYDWYRVWNFANRGQTLHVVVESCARTCLTDRQHEFTYARDHDSLTVYARDREVLEQLLARLRIAHSTFDGAMLLLETMSDSVRYE